jgi:23S rRNA (uridine2552-2'-O)-methyltransferase
MKRRDPHQWQKERNRDKYFIQAKKEGYRARSAYKLLEINQKYSIIHGNVLDLGAAPGAWLQVAKNLGAQVEGIDLLEIKEMAGVVTLKADIFSQEAAEFLKNKQYDALLCDIAPNCCGEKTTDHLILINIAYKVLELSLMHLKPSGSICIKIFDGAGFKDFFAKFHTYFKEVYRFKPASSFLDSNEFYIIGKFRL